MGIFELFILAVGLSMDAFAVSICKGLCVQRTTLKHMVIAGLWFGGFQALMPFIGYTLGSAFTDYIIAVDHWIAFILLALIGGNMLKEAFGDEDDCECSCEIDKNPFGFKTMLTMAIATSIDALAVGVTFAFLRVNIWWAIAFIGVTTFCLSGIAIKIGSIFGSKFKSKAEIAGGLILIILGVKILVEHTLLA